MNVRLFDGPMSTSPAVAQRVMEKVTQALRHVSERIGDVQVWLRDVNGGKGGVDKQVRIVAQVAHASPLVVESHDSDYYRAIDGAAAKLSRAAQHKLTRR